MPKVPPIFSSFLSVNSPYYQNNKQSDLSQISSERGSSCDLSPFKNKVVRSALKELADVKFLSEDISYLNSLGAKVAFLSGKEVVDFIINENVRIEFGKTSSKDAFAQYNYPDKVILINNRYSNPKNHADILAISEAVLHEAGHAKDKDTSNSLQEEIDNLALNVLAHNFYSKKYPDVFLLSNSLLVKDGVELYSKLFYDNDPKLSGLVNRLDKKYGFLPEGDYLHPPSELAKRVKVK